MTSTYEDTDMWRFELEDNKQRWANQLMGYASSGNPLGSTGIRWLKFSRLEDAVNFAERQGYNYYVDQPNPRKSFEGEKLYALNFLNAHVRARRATWPKKDVCQTQFGHPERGTTAWVNLKHSSFGLNPSRTVSATEWSDPHPNKHTAKNWYRATLKQKQENARRVGK
mmetsp:Transcript_7743/g.24729  ORF Transcript_7743/g.24729 Transcript_7743/m.24729 type:complete len:168 (-) Transcript_7743:84-587(-)